MAADIVPIELGLTAGNLVTLWAPRWREGGEEWEAFLGSGEHLYAFPDVAHLAAFIRTETEHDLADHPEWDDVPDALVDQLEPADERKFDLIGVLELVGDPPDIWTVGELAGTVAILRSLAEVCELDVVTEVLDSADGFDLLSMGDSAFVGRSGEKLWTEIGTTVVARWDEVVDAIDALVVTPDVDPEALAQAKAELSTVSKLTLAQADPDDPDDTDDTDGPDAAPGRRARHPTHDHDTEADTAERSPDLAFWDEIGIDCISVEVGGRVGYSLRCYLDDEPVFLAEAGRIQLFTEPAALVEYLADPVPAHSLANLEVFAEIRDEAATGDLAVAVAPTNAYVLDGLMQQLIRGPEAVDRRRLELAVELLVDAADARGDQETAEAVGTSTPLGFLLAAILRPDPARMSPTPPFTDEVTAWNVIVESFEYAVEWRPPVATAR